MTVWSSRNMADGIRINKYLSSSGHCSRREADRLIEQGLVRIDGVPALPGSRVFEGQTVTVSGTRIHGGGQAPVIYAVNKPAGVICSSRRQGTSPILEDLLDVPERVFYAGRLDKDSEGLILVTNQGDLANAIMKARNRHEKEYEVQVDRPVTEAFVREMQGGVWLEELGCRTRECSVRQMGEKSFRIILTQGLNRQIRRMCHALGYEVKRLRRIRIMNIQLGQLQAGAFRKLTKEETEQLTLLARR